MFKVNDEWAAPKTLVSFSAWSPGERDQVIPVDLGDGPMTAVREDVIAGKDLALVIRNGQLVFVEK